MAKPVVSKTNNEPTTKKGKERRKHWRLPLRCQVEYEFDGKTAAAFADNLSRGGLFLRGAQHLPVGQVLELAIHLEGQAGPLTIRGQIVGLNLDATNGGVHVSFVDSREEKIQQVQRYIEGQLLPKFESVVKELWPKAAQFIGLAGVHADNDASPKAQLKMEGTGANIHEHRARMTLEQALYTSSEAWKVITELEDVVLAGRVSDRVPFSMAFTPR